MTKESLVNETLKLAENTLEEARVLLEANKIRGALSRAYYAMFDAGRALLYSKDIETKTHKDVIALLGEHFVKTKELDAWFSKTIKNAFNLRQEGDYEIEVNFGKEAVEQTVKDAEKFVKGIKDFLKLIK